MSAGGSDGYEMMFATEREQNTWVDITTERAVSGAERARCGRYRLDGTSYTHARRGERHGVALGGVRTQCRNGP